MPRLKVFLHGQTVAGTVDTPYKTSYCLDAVVTISDEDAHTMLFRDAQYRRSHTPPRRCRRPGTALLVLLGLLMLPLACSRDENAIPIDFSVREEVAVSPEAEQVLTYAYLPQFSHTVSFQRHHLLIRYLEKETGLRIRQVFPDTFDEHMRMVGQGKYS